MATGEYTRFGAVSGADRIDTGSLGDRARRLDSRAHPHRVCDDKVIQAIGRDRGVRRTVANPLEVQVLADEALPLVHDSVVYWDSVRPDLIQKMRLAGLAVDSPADAAALHPSVMLNAEQAKKCFLRGVFRGQIPVGNTHREMSLTSDRYLRSGLGRSWQRA